MSNSRGLKLDLSGHECRGCHWLAEQKLALGLNDCGIEKLVWRESYGQNYLEVIFREGWSRTWIAGGIATQSQDAQGTADLGVAKGRGFGIGEGTELAGASFGNVAGELARERGGLGTRALRVGKNVEVGEGPPSNEL